MKPVDKTTIESDATDDQLENLEDTLTEETDDLICEYSGLPSLKYYESLQNKNK